MRAVSWEHVGENGIVWEVHGCTRWSRRIYCYKGQAGRFWKVKLDCVGMFDPDKPSRPEPDTSAWPMPVQRQWVQACNMARKAVRDEAEAIGV